MVVCFILRQGGQPSLIQIFRVARRVQWLALAHVYGQPTAAIALSDHRLTDAEAERIARLIVRLPELVELERDRNKAHATVKQLITD